MGVPVIVYTPPERLADTPGGNDPDVSETPVAPPPKAYVILVMALFTQTVCAVVAATDVSVSAEGRFTVMLIPLLVAGFPVAQGVALEVSTTLTTSPLLRVVEVKLLVAVGVPTSMLLMRHW